MTESAPRLHAFDGARVLGAIGIVWFHADTSSRTAAFGYAGLPVFLVIGFFLLVRGLRSQPLAELVRSRARRVLVPFALWTAVYCAMVKCHDREELHDLPRGLTRSWPVPSWVNTFT